MEEQEKMELVVRRYADIAYLTRKNYLQPNDFLDRYYSVVIRIWQKLEEHVKYERERRHDPHWARDLEWLADQAMTFRSKYYPGSSVEVISRGKPTDKENRG